MTARGVVLFWWLALLLWTLALAGSVRVVRHLGGHGRAVPPAKVVVPAWRVPRSLCVQEEVRDVAWSPCDAPGSIPVAKAHHPVRRLVGLPLCWSQAREADFRSIQGIGERRAVALEAYRHDGGAPVAEEVRQAVPGIGRAADLVAERMGGPCVPWPGKDP